MSTFIRIGRNVAANWVAFVVSVGVAFFLSPFLVNRLGNLGYGVWALLNSTIAYMGLLDLGLRGGVTRFVSRHHAEGQHLESGRVVYAALWLRAWIGIVVVIASLVLSVIATSVFRIPVELQASARRSILLLGLSFAVTLTSGVFGAVLTALHRFDLLSAVQISQTLLRVTGVVWALRSGYGIVALALWELLLALGAGVGLTGLALKQYPQLRFAFTCPASAVLRQLWNYSLYILIINSAAQIIYYTDNVVVGAFVSAGAVTFFAIAGGLLEYTRQIVSGLGLVLFPLASSLDAENRDSELQSLLVNGTRATLLIALPIQATLFFRGHTFISLWIGAEQAHVSGKILQILLVAHIFAIANYTSFNVVCGLGKHRPVALAVSTEAIANLVLSIILVRRMGLEGVAWGTVVPSLAIQLLFWPRYIGSILNISTWRYLSEGWLRSACSVVPFGLASFLADRLWPPTNLAEFLFQTAVLAPVFLLSAGVAFRDQISGELRMRLKSLSAA